MQTNTSIGLNFVRSTDCLIDKADLGATAANGSYVRKEATLSPARMAHMPANLPINLLARIVKIVTFGLKANGSADCDL